MIDKPVVNETEDGKPGNTGVDFGEFRDEGRGGKRGRSAGVWFALLLSVLALLFTAIGIAAGYKHWQRMNDKARANAADIAELRERLQETPSAEAMAALRQQVEEKTAAAVTNAKEAVQEMARMQNQTRQFADTVASQVEQVTFLQGKMQKSAAPATAEDWKVAEAEFLLQLANRELHLANDIETAVTALREADAVLARLGSVNYLPVRQQISRDISTLEAATPPDVSGLSQRINALMLSLQPLPVLEVDSVGAEPVSVAEGAADTVEGNSLWADYKRKALSTLNEAVVIRRHDKPIQAELDADTRLRLYQLLRLRLESLRLLALQRDTQGFREQAQLIQETIREYYPSAQSAPLLEKLEGFSEVELEFSPPDISASLKQLESARHAESASPAEAEEGDKSE